MLEAISQHFFDRRLVEYNAPDFETRGIRRKADGRRACVQACQHALNRIVAPVKWTGHAQHLTFHG